MSKKKTTQEADGFGAVENALTKTERYIEDNQKSLTIIAVAIVAVIGIFFGYKKFYLAPIENEAREQMYAAEQYFERDSFRLALNGDGNNFGFIDIIDEYGISKSANLAQFYSGICYLRLGDYTTAIEFLKGFDADDKMVAPIALGAIGDAYLELSDNKKALEYYNKASDDFDNPFTAPIFLMKVALVHELNGDYDKALTAYERIDKDYPNSTEGRQVIKYIARAKLKINQ